MQKSLCICALCLVVSESLGVMATNASAQAASSPPPYVPKIVPRLIGTQIQTMGAEDIGTGRLGHVRCKKEADCSLDVKVRIHPHDDQNRACLLNVKPMVYIHPNALHKTITWRLVPGGTSPPAFQFVRGREVEIADNVDDINGSSTLGSQVFKFNAATATTVTYDILTKIPKGFSYTINVEYPDPSGGPMPIACAPLDPIIVNRD